MTSAYMPHYPKPTPEDINPCEELEDDLDLDPDGDQDQDEGWEEELSSL